MNLYRLKNTSSSWWYFAETFEDAVQGSVDDGRSPKPENIVLIYYRSVPDSFHSGIGSKEIQTSSVLNLLEMINAPQKTPEELHKERYSGWRANGKAQPYSPQDDWLQLSNTVYGPEHLEIIAGDNHE